MPAVVGEFQSQGVGVLDMALPEKMFKKKVTRVLRRTEGVTFFIKEALGLRGIADLIICSRGRFVAWELKATKGSAVTPLQLHFLKEVRNCGGIGRVVYPENFKECLEEVLKE